MGSIVKPGDDQMLVNLPNDIFAPCALILPNDMQIESAETLMKWFVYVEHGSRWWVGDLAIFAEAHYSEEFSQIIDDTGYAPHTIQNAKWVCSRFSPSRRRENLPFGVYEELASLMPREQDTWLDICETEGLTIRELRKRLAESRSISKREEPQRKAIEQPQWSDSGGIKDDGSYKELDDFFEGSGGTDVNADADPVFGNGNSSVRADDADYIPPSGKREYAAIPNDLYARWTVIAGYAGFDDTLEFMADRAAFYERQFKITG